MRYWPLFLGLAVGPAWAAETPVVPEPLPLSRYEGMMAQSPFVLATPPAAPPAPKEAGFAENWNVTSLYMEPGKDGVEQPFVTIRSRDQRVSFSLLGDEQSTDKEAEGVTIANIEWNEEAPAKSVVWLKKGTESGRVEFGQETSPAPPANPAMAQGVRQPGGPANTGMPGTGLRITPQSGVPQPGYQPSGMQQNGLRPPAKGNFLPRPAAPMPMLPGVNPAAMQQQPGQPPGARGKVRVVGVPPQQ